jgi:tryptophan synthase alpha chain
MSGEERIREAFDRARQEGRGALVTYVMGGDPGPGQDQDVIRALAEGGADIIEVGIPFSDPIADGPTIQRAAVRALQHDTHPRDVLQAVRTVRDEGLQTPIVVMTYANIPYTMGYTDFAETLSKSGVDGAIIADMPVEECHELRAAMRAEGLALVLLAGPMTQGKRLQEIAQTTSGFLYLVGSFGTTGARKELAPETLEVLEGVLPAARAADVPLAVGFGVSTADQAARLVAAGADGVVVGSALVEMVEKGEPPEQLLRMVRMLREGVQRASG